MFAKFKKKIFFTLFLLTIYLLAYTLNKYFPANTNRLETLGNSKISSRFQLPGYMSFYAKGKVTIMNIDTKEYFQSDLGQDLYDNFK